MNGWLDNPAVQAGAAPFLAALIWGLLTWRVERLLVLGGVIGFLVTVVLVADLSLTPFTSTRKIIWSVLAATAFAWSCDYFCPPRRLVHNLWWVLGGGAALWVVWPVITYQGGWQGAVIGAGALGYAALQIALGDSLRQDEPPATAIAWVLAMTSGAVCLLGASAFLGQLGLGLGSAVLAVWLVIRLRGELERPGVLVIPAVLGAALLGVAGAVYAQVPWLSLLFLLMVPVVQWLPVPAWAEGEREPWYRVGVSAVPALMAVGWTLAAEGPPPF